MGKNKRSRSKVKKSKVLFGIPKDQLRLVTAGGGVIIEVTRETDGGVIIE